MLLSGCSMPFEKIARNSRPQQIELPAKIEFVGPPKGKPILSMHLPAGIYEYVGEDADTWLYLHRDDAFGSRNPIPGFMTTIRPHDWPAGLALFKRYDGYCAAFLVDEPDAREMAGEIGAALMPKIGAWRIFRDIFPIPATETARFIQHGNESLEPKEPAKRP